MKEYLLKKDSPFRKMTGTNQSININYSESEFFYEGQECRPKEDGININNDKVKAKDKKRNHFRGNFNIFF